MFLAFALIFEIKLIEQTGCTLLLDYFYKIAVDNDYFEEERD